MFDFLQAHSLSRGKINWHFSLLIGLAITLQILAHTIRARKSRLLLDRIRKSETSKLFQGLSVGYLFNSLLPFRLGEFIRAFYIGDALAISKTTVLMSIVIERLVDSIILGVGFVLAGIWVLTYSSSAFLIMVQLGIGLLIIATILGLLLHVIRSENKTMLHALRTFSNVFNERMANRVKFMAWSGIYGTRLMLSDKYVMRKYYLLSLFMWFIYFCSTASVALAFFNNLTFTNLWFIVQASYAGVSTPAGPGYIGTFHLVVFNILNKLGGLISISGFSLFMWLVLTVPISLIGLSVLIKQRFNNSHSVHEQEALINKLHRETDISTELSHFLDAYLNGEEINQILTQAELEGKFRLIKSFKGGSNAHTVLVWQGTEMRVKKITLLQFADKLIAQARWLMEYKSLEHIPNLVDEHTTSQYYSFDLAYKEDFLPLFEYIHSHTTKESYHILTNALSFMDKNIYHRVPTKNGYDNVLQYIDQKVICKINDTAVLSSEVSQLMNYKKLIINGVTFENIFRIINRIKKHKGALMDLSNYMESPIHGDFTVDNLIASPDGDFLLLDPNNENQVSSPVVDYAKLYQSLHSGYEFLIQLNESSIIDHNIYYEDAKSQKYAALYELIDKQLRSSLSPVEYRSILFHEATHYCRMLTYRANINPRTTSVFYATAVKLFNEFLAQYDKN